jgi:hypothetical protein
MKAQTQIRIGLVSALIIVVCLVLLLIVELLSKSWSSFGIGLLVTLIFVTYIQGLIKKDLKIARRAYRTYFVFWLIASGIILILLPFQLHALRERYEVSFGGCILLLLFWVGSFGFSALVVFLLHTGIKGLSQIPEVKNSSSKARLLWWAFVPFLIILLLIILMIGLPLLGALMRVLRP